MAHFNKKPSNLLHYEWVYDVGVYPMFFFFLESYFKFNYNISWSCLVFIIELYQLLFFFSTYRFPLVLLVHTLTH